MFTETLVRPIERAVGALMLVDGLSLGFGLGEQMLLLLAIVDERESTGKERVR